jgi:hypothetical protein
MSPKEVRDEDISSFMGKARRKKQACSTHAQMKSEELTQPEAPTSPNVTPNTPKNDANREVTTLKNATVIQSG